VEILLDDLSGAEIARFLAEHLAHMRSMTPAESVYAHDLERLRPPDITFWSAWEGSELVGCAALKELDARSGEIKSMRTAEAWRRTGVARALVDHIVAEALRRSYELLYLETGATDRVDAARALYSKHGFEPCSAFGDYRNDPHSFFMRKRLGAGLLPS
jgi:putative acetyltransferase